MVRYCPVCTTPREEAGPFDCCSEVQLKEEVKRLKAALKKERSKYRKLKDLVRDSMLGE